MVKTARRHVPAIFKKVDGMDMWRGGACNLDVGGGPYCEMDLALRSKGVTNLRFDIYVFSALDNDHTLKFAKTTASTATISNVLNVIQRPSARRQLLELARDNTMPCATIFITVYAGNRSGEGSQTKCGWQANKVLSSYLEEVKSVFKHAYIKYGMIVAPKS